MTDPQCPNCITKSTTEYKFSCNKFDIYLCLKCLNGFTFPAPKFKELVRYYHTGYWIPSGFLGFIKNQIFNFFQNRRKKWIEKYLYQGKILDVGAGEGRFVKSLKGRYYTLGLDAPNAKIRNKNILKVDFLRWKTKKRFEAIVFWESLEHMSKPQEYLKKASKLIKNGGYIFIEYPRFDSLEAKFFKQHWFHLDPPRHLSHLTEKGLKIILSRSELKVISHKSISAFEYTTWGFLASLLQMANIKKTNPLKQKDFILLLIYIFLLSILSVISEIVFLLLNQSPIGLMVARKK